MSFILNIDTSTDVASICLAKNGDALQTMINEEQKDHAAWLHPAIDKILHEAGLAIKDIDAIAVTIGPGSYTGLRVGLATAKGICYAMNIPLITPGTFEMMTAAVKNEATDLLCTMIDARRMEVFCAVYDKNLKVLLPPQSKIIDEKSFSEFLSTHKILFCGNGCKKFQTVVSNTNALFSSVVINASAMSSISYQRFSKNEFADIAYTTPFYIKEFYLPFRKPSL